MAAHRELLHHYIACHRLDLAKTVAEELILLHQQRSSTSQPQSSGESDSGLNPFLQYAEILYSLADVDGAAMQLARQYFAAAVEQEPTNVRALLGLMLVRISD